MSSSIVASAADARTVHVIDRDGFDQLKQGLPSLARGWLDTTGFKPRPQSAAYWPDETGRAGGAVLVCSSPVEPWDASMLRSVLPDGTWKLDDPKGLLPPSEAVFGWIMQGYGFDRYKSKGADGSEQFLCVQPDADVRRMQDLAGAIALGRDLVNTPANDLGPAELADAVLSVAGRHGVVARTIVGDALLEQNFPLIHAVGAASNRAPRLIDMVWGNEAHPKVTLVGKGVCFDTGGLDLKPASAMGLMKKDMGGSAAMLALADAIMSARLPVRLRLLVAAVENSVSGNAFRPGDVFKSRKGITVEIGNTDAEGRLILADALAFADEEEPEILVDAATLTGAARVALGPDLPVLFANDDKLAADILLAGETCAEPLWRLPLHQPYRRLIKGKTGDIDNSGTKPFAGSITAALFLESFVEKAKSWAHLDVYGINGDTRPGRPAGGEAVAVRALFEMLRNRYGDVA
ncbi:MAG: leucyl aminopeptidase family protein [Geminicoccaceae bacterium]|nr:leucyl aminopeptidase family protein [Geminicoccaceae bacterium]